MQKGKCLEIEWIMISHVEVLVMSVLENCHFEFHSILLTALLVYNNLFFVRGVFERTWSLA